MEDYPLLPTVGRGTGKTGTLHRYETNEPPHTRVQIEEYEEEEDGEENDKILFADGKKRGTSLILNDGFFIILHFLQMWAVLQSLALRWTWPGNWLKATNFIFLFNLDVWEFMKVHGNNTYQNVQGYFTPTATLTICYWNILVAWGVFVFLSLTALIIAHIIITYKRHPFMMVQISQMQRVYVIGVQFIYLPFGIIMARLFHCNDSNKMDVDNNITCWEGEHWAYIAPALAVSTGLFILFPAWLITRTKREMLNMTTDRHEGYLQLKETEYVQGLDILYVVGNFHIFSSFKKHGAHYRALQIVIAYAILIIYAALFKHIFTQAVIINVILFMMLVVFIIIRPYRVYAFNLQLIITYMCLNCACLIGALRSNFTSFTLQTIWLTPDYLMWILGVILVFWLIATAVFLTYLMIKQFMCCNMCKQSPLWPTMDSQGLKKLSPQTRKFIRTVIKGRTLVERTLQMPPMFAPAHELSRYIHIVNAYCREAEHIRDPIHDTLWDLLDELIEAHDQIAPRSLFADSVKESIRHTAAEFMKIMPAFVRRVAQREYDFILLTPLKRRILLKMYCLALFLNGRRQNQERQRITLPRIQKVWPLSKQYSDFEDDGYYEDMYPEVEQRPEHRPVTAISIDLMSHKALDDDLALEEAEQFTNDHPLSRQFYTNIAFQNDSDTISEILRDDVSEMLSLDVPGSTQTASSSTGFKEDSAGARRSPSPLGNKGQHGDVLWATSPLPGQIEDENNFDSGSPVIHPVVRPGAAAGLTGPTPGVSPIELLQENRSSITDQMAVGTTSTPHPGTTDGRPLSSYPGSINSEGTIEAVSPEEIPGQKSDLITIGQITTNQSEA